MSHEPDLFFMCLLACTSLFENCLLKLFAHFLTELSGFLFIELLMSWILILSHGMLCKFSVGCFSDPSLPYNFLAWQNPICLFCDYLSACVPWILFCPHQYLPMFFMLTFSNLMASGLEFSSTIPCELSLVWSKGSGGLESHFCTWQSNFPRTVCWRDCSSMRVIINIFRNLFTSSLPGMRCSYH